jgi:hypothetical protein
MQSLPDKLATPSMLKVGVQQSASIRFRTAIRNSDGTYAKVNPWRKNTIMDVGLDALGNTHCWNACLGYCALGTSNDGNRRDTSPVTVSQAGTTLTASGSFFLSTDVGALFKFGTGSAGLEVYIVSVTSPTVAVVNIPSTQTGQVGTLWFVNQTALVSQVIAPFSTTYAADIIGFTNTAGVATTTLTRHFISPAFGASHTIQELAWYGRVGGFSPVPNEMFGRALVGGVGDAVSTGQQYEVICELSIVATPRTATPFGDVSSGTWNTAGNGTLEFAEGCFGSIFSGNDSAAGALESVHFPCTMYLAVAGWTQVDMTTSAVSLPGGSVISDSNSASSYTSGTFTRSCSSFWGVTSAVATIHGIIVSVDTQRDFSLLFTTPIAKDNLHSLTITWTISWQRVLTN